MDAKGIARALRKELSGLGLDITHSQALELMARTAGLKDWNVLSAQPTGPLAPAPATTGYHCPGCGKQGTLKSPCTAFVEQGPSNEDGYLCEGNADHYYCSACGHQFLDWSSDWPWASEQSGYLVLLGRVESGAWVAFAYAAGDVLAVLATHGWGPGYPYGLCVDNLEAIGQVLNEEVARGEENRLGDRLDDFGVGAYYCQQGSTPQNALQALFGSLPPGIVLHNRDIGTVPVVK